MPKPRKGENLSTKQKLFVAEYLACMNATQAALRAGYSVKTAGSIGYENLQKPQVKELIDFSLENRLTSASDQFEQMVRQRIKAKSISPSAYVYFIHSANGLTKIGVASDVKKRLHTLNTASPVELELLFYFEPKDAKRTETYLHKVFAHKRIKGEWFNLTSRDIAKVAKRFNVIQSVLEN